MWSMMIGRVFGKFSSGSVVNNHCLKYEQGWVHPLLLPLVVGVNVVATEYFTYTDVVVQVTTSHIYQVDNAVVSLTI